jgi:hypothetical protein
MGLKKLQFRKLRMLEGKNKHLNKSLEATSARIREAIRSYNGSIIRRVSIPDKSFSEESSVYGAAKPKSLNVSMSHV